MYSIHEQYIDIASGFHIIKLRDPSGKKHVIQIAVGADRCPMCGVAYPKDNLSAIDPTAMIASVSNALEVSQANVQKYAEKHKLKVK